MTSHAPNIFIYLSFTHFLYSILLSYLLVHLFNYLFTPSYIYLYLLLYLSLCVQTWEFLGARQTTASTNSCWDSYVSLCFSLVLLDTLSNGKHYDHFGGRGDHYPWPWHGSWIPCAVGYPSAILYYYLM